MQYQAEASRLMKVRSIAGSRDEIETLRILRRALEKAGYRVNRAVRVSTVIEADWRAFDGERRNAFRTMQCGFVITQGDDLIPQFVVEFDGPHVTPDSTAARLDALINEFCMEAGLPVLRISSQELESHEHISVLAWIVERWVAFRREYPGIVREMQERWELLADDCPVEPETEEFYDRLVDCDPSVWFDLRHPYPALLTVSHRLRRLGVAGPEMMPEDVAKTTRAGRKIWAQWIPVGGVDNADPLFSSEWRATTRKVEVIPWEISETWPERRTLFSTAQTVRMRCALPVGWNALNFPSDSAANDLNAEPLITRLWHNELPGAARCEIAEGLAEYLALRDVEQWARQHCAAAAR
jgi:hypothetical protein